MYQSVKEMTSVGELSADRIDRLVWTAVFGADPELRGTARWTLKSAAAAAGIRPASIHDLYIAMGRGDAGGCTLAQPNFEQMAELHNLIFRIPTPVFGTGLIENIADATILTNMRANAFLKGRLGISGHPNFSGNDGTISRFGWKAQNKSLEIFTGEAYNVEMGVTNELFPDERGTPPADCLINPTPEDVTNFDLSGDQIPSDVVGFSHFMRFLARHPGQGLVHAIEQHASSSSEAHTVISHFNQLSTQQKQDLLNFLRSL